MAAVKRVIGMCMPVMLEVGLSCSGALARVCMCVCARTCCRATPVQTLSARVGVSLPKAMGPSMAAVAYVYGVRMSVMFDTGL